MNNLNKFSLHYKLNKKNYIEAKQINAFRSHNLRKGLLYSFLIMFSGVLELIKIKNPELIIINFNNNYYDQEITANNLSWSLVVIGLGIFTLFSEIFPKYNMFSQWKLSRSYQKNFVNQEFRHLEIDEIQIKLFLDSFREIRSWQSYIKFVESSKMFLLYYDKEGYQIIPKQAFNSESDINLFRNLLETKITK